MDGIHDLGGKHGFGKVVVEEDEPVFHARWEAAVFTMSAVGSAVGAWNNTDRFRHAVERIDPVAYLTHTYYGRWLGGIESMLVEAKIVSREAINDKVMEMGGSEFDLIASRPNPVPDPMGTVGEGDESRRSSKSKPEFNCGDRVRTSKEVKSGHTRLPAYARGKTGEIVLSHDSWIYPDTNAHGQGENPQYLYTVQFSGEELWGHGAVNTKVSLDLFEPYLELVE
jgi:nitrile hydratase subunit beta